MKTLADKPIVDGWREWKNWKRKNNFPKVPKGFDPNITHPAYIVRKLLLRAIKKHAWVMQGTIMDFGCGSKPYASLFETSKYVGVDFNGKGHQHNFEAVDVYYDGHQLPFEDNRFDNIFSTEVFEHVFNLEEMLKEINRVMKPNGKILITCPFSICEHEMPNDYARYSSYGLKDLLQRNGFEVMIFEKLGSAWQTMAQMFISYVHFHFTRRFFGRIPIVRTILNLLITTVLNYLSIVLNWIMPKGEDLYLNNLVIAKKTANPQRTELRNISNNQEIYQTLKSV